MVDVDVAVVGGGIQGLVVLRELVSAGYGAVLITNAELGCGQTLHSHGLLNSGTGLVTGLLQQELHELTLPYLRQLGVPVYGEERSFLLAPGALVDQLTPVWEANRYPPERIYPPGLPPGLEPVAPVYRVRGFNVDKRRLVAALSAGLEPLILGGDLIDASEAVRVSVRPSGEVVSFEARAVVVAAGCGTKRLLREVFAFDGVVVDRITYTKAHMVCVRGPAGVLPDVATVVSPEVMIVGHPSPDGSRAQGVIWYVTPATLSPPRYSEAPDDGAADVEVPVVKSGIDALVRLVPSLRQDDERIQATVFAGYKQEFDGEPTRRACQLVDAERIVIFALPSVLSNAMPNAREVLTVIRQRLEPTNSQSELREAAAVTVGQLNEDVDPTRWANWHDFAQLYGAAIS